MSNNLEKFNRHKKRLKLEDTLKEYEDVQMKNFKKNRVDPIPTEKTPIPQLVSQERKGIASKNGLYTLAEISNLVKRKKEIFAKLGFTNVTIVPFSEIEGYNETVYAVEIEGTKKGGTKVRGHITLRLEAPQNTNNTTTCQPIEYFVKTPDVEQHLETIQIPEGFDFEWIQEYSKGAKVVKSRPMWMYEDWMGVNKKELWPQNADIAVIGDPYQKCDRERVTIIEYEYADEMIPHTLIDSLVDSENPEKIEQETRNFYEDIYRENIQSLQRLYGGYDPQYGNPYKYAVSIMSHYLGKYAANMGKEKEELQKKIKRIKELTTKLIDGTWTLEEGKELAAEHFSHLKDTQLGDKKFVDGIPEEVLEDLEKWFEYKNYSINGLGDPEAWADYVARWNNYLSKLHIKKIQETIPDIEKKISQSKHFLEILPTTKSTQRMHAAMGYLREFSHELLQKAYDEKDPELKEIYDPAIWYIEEGGMMGDGALSFFRPGTPLSNHNASTLTEFMDRLDQLTVYEKKIYPGLQLLHRQIHDDKIPLDSNMQKSFLKTFESAAARNMFFRKRTQKATPIHGFFPHNFAGIDPQDRIIALTSVTMHAWNHLDKNGFYKDIDASLPFLKQGGKYILGPINQHVYFGGYGNDFDCEGLTNALQKLKREGKIEYTFIKGRHEQHGGYDTFDNYEEEEFSEDPEILLPNESAKSLIITRK